MNVGSLTQPMVSFSFDDGLTNHFDVVVPVLDSFGFKATFYIPSRLIDRKDRISKEQLLQLQQAGHEIGAHGRRHRLLVSRMNWILKNEIAGSKKDLEASRLAVETFAYPFGQFDERVFPFLKKAGYTGARSNQPGLNYFYTNHYELCTLSVGPSTSFEQIEEKIQATIFQNAWLIFEFHQVEDSSHHLATGKQLFGFICEQVKASSIRVTKVKDGVKELETSRGKIR